MVEHAGIIGQVKCGELAGIKQLPNHLTAWKLLFGSIAAEGAGVLEFVEDHDDGRSVDAFVDILDLIVDVVVKLFAEVEIVGFIFEVNQFGQAVYEGCFAYASEAPEVNDNRVFL